MTVAEWFRRWRRLFPAEASRATREHERYMLRPFLEAYGERELGDITPLLAQQWAVGNPGQVRYLRLAFEKATAMQLVPFNVWRLVQIPARRTPARPVPSLKQVDAAIALARGESAWFEQFADLIEATAFTGARLGGITRLRARDVDLERRRAQLTEKGAKTRTVVLLPRAHDALTRALERRQRRAQLDGGLVFVAMSGRALTRERVASCWRRVRGDFPGPFHSLKHFAGTYLAAQGVDERDIAIQLGHTDSMGRPYTQLVRRVYVHPDHNEALERIEAATTTKGA